MKVQFWDIANAAGADDAGHGTRLPQFVLGTVDECRLGRQPTLKHDCVGCMVPGAAEAVGRARGSYFCGAVLAKPEEVTAFLGVRGARVVNTHRAPSHGLAIDGELAFDNRDAAARVLPTVVVTVVVIIVVVVVVVVVNKWVCGRVGHLVQSRTRGCRACGACLAHAALGNRRGAALLRLDEEAPGNRDACHTDHGLVHANDTAFAVRRLAHADSIRRRNDERWGERVLDQLNAFWEQRHGEVFARTRQVKKHAAAALVVRAQLGLDVLKPRTCWVIAKRIEQNVNGERCARACVCVRVRVCRDAPHVTRTSWLKRRSRHSSDGCRLWNPPVCNSVLKVCKLVGVRCFTVTAVAVAVAAGVSSIAVAVAAVVPAVATVAVMIPAVVAISVITVVAVTTT